MNNKLFMAPIERKIGFDKYCEIVNLASSTADLTTCEYFQRLFNRYYVVRRNKDWRESFYSIFQDVKLGSTTCEFNSIIDAVYDKTKGCVEPSFSSKMLSVFDADKPILDSQVTANLDISWGGNTPEQRLESAKEAYNKICRKYSNFLSTDNCKEAVKKFNEMFPNYSGQLSVTKKIDYFLWSFTLDELKQSELFGGLI